MFLSVVALGVLAVSCSDNDDNESTTSGLTLNLEGLEALGDDFVYEGWIIVDEQPVSTGTFTSVDFPQTFQVNTSQLEEATDFVLSIEPADDSDPEPAATKILSGTFSGDSATVNSNAMVGDFGTSTGTYILATPTDTDDTNEESGVWFLDNSSGSAMAGLDLPTLSDGWKYEGWVVMNEMAISTGTFTDPASADDNAATSVYKGDDNDGPSFPGEDYLQNPPSGLTFPTDLKGTTIVISVEPYPDNNASPFTIKPLAHVVPSDAADHTAITMEDGPLASLSGTVVR